MKENRKKTVKRHLKLKSLFLLLTLVVVIPLFLFYLYQMPIRNIYIEGNVYLKDKDVIEVAGIKDYPRMFKYNNSTLKKRILTLDLVDTVTIKKSLFGKLTIQIKEASVLFYNRPHATYVLSNGEETPLGEYVGIPFLINSVPNQIYERLIKELTKVKKESLALVSEMEYSPSKSGEITIDDTRFLLRMNDGNHVFINLINIDRLDTYPLIYTLFTEKGILELDSDNDRVVFKSFKSLEGNKTSGE